MESLNTKNYYKIRKIIVDKNANLVGNVLNDKERIVDNYLEKLKKEYINSFDTVSFQFPVLREKRIWDTDLYQFCRDLPKGSDLHVHGTSLLPMKELIDFIIRHESLLICLDNYTLYTKTNKPHNKKCYSLRYALDHKLIKYNDLFNKWTILGVKHHDDNWKYFENLFSYFETIDLDLNILYDYYVEAFEYYLNLNIYHLEIHLLLSTNYEEAYATVETIKKAYHFVKSKHHELLVNIIGAGMKLKQFGIKDALSRLENCYKIQQSIKDDYDPNNISDFIIGFDLINEEDSSRPLKEYAKELMKFSKKHPSINYFLHSGESLDPNSDNLIDAYLLNAKRVGHGMNLYRYPSLLKDYANKEICLEVCPISNQVLRYVKNIRLHPALEYIKRGVTVSLCSDDPIFFEHTALVDDFLAIIISFDLKLADVKQLCINSILYSCLNSKQRTQLLKTFKYKWNKFINVYTSKGE